MIINTNIVKHLVLHLVIQLLINILCTQTVLQSGIYKTLIRPIVRHGGIAWTLTKAVLKGCRPLKRQVLRPMLEGGMWMRRKTSIESYDVMKGESNKLC